MGRPSQLVGVGREPGLAEFAQHLSQGLIVLDRTLSPASGGWIVRIKEARLDIGREGHAARVLFQLGALLESEPERERGWAFVRHAAPRLCRLAPRSEEHTSELQSLMRISYAFFCLKKKKPSPTILLPY